MTDERIAELEDLCAAATPGPWTANGVTGMIWAENDEVGTCIDISGNDSVFVAAARAALPEALAEIRRLRQRLAEIESCPTSRGGPR